MLGCFRRLQGIACILLLCGCATLKDSWSPEIGMIANEELQRGMTPHEVDAVLTKRGLSSGVFSVNSGSSYVSYHSKRGKDAFLGLKFGPKDENNDRHLLEWEVKK